MGIGHEPNGGVTYLDIPWRNLPSGDEFTILVRPVTSLGTFGAEIRTIWKPERSS